MKNKLAWFDARKKRCYGLIENLYKCNISNIIVGINELSDIAKYGNCQFIVEVTNENQLKNINSKYFILSKNKNVLDIAHTKGYKTVALFKITDSISMDEAWKSGRKYDFIIVYLDHPSNIPLELLIARLQPFDTKIIKYITDISDISVIENVMEVGSDGFLIDCDNYESITEYTNKKATIKFELKKAIVSSVIPLSKGYRACIDTTMLLDKNEGFIVGSTSKGGLLVVSETHHLPYMKLRPFRVNAGAIHSYIWKPDQSTAYISELEAGECILCVDSSGNTRRVHVGRVKIEIRPLLMIKATIDEIEVNTIVQDDWHVRMMKYGGGVINLSDIKKGTELIGYATQTARHVGLPISEHIIEK